MKLASIRLNRQETAAIITDHGALPTSAINKLFHQNWPEDVLSILSNGKLDDIKEWFDQNRERLIQNPMDSLIPSKDIRFAPLYRRPRKIWGIGLNYRAHAADLSEKAPVLEPASFMKPDTAIIGHGGTIRIPVMSEKTTGEAELGLIFSKKCAHVEKEDWRSVIAGVTPIIDMTAEDILRRNPRNLTQSKSFDTFFSFGPILHTLDEVTDILNLKIQTVINGQVHAENIVSNMTFPLEFLVSYHSRIMTMLPGDIISTGTPGAVALKDGDMVECRIEGFETLSNPVIDLKLKQEGANEFRA